MRVRHARIVENTKAQSSLRERVPLRVVCASVFSLIDVVDLDKASLSEAVAICHMRSTSPRQKHRKDELTRFCEWNYHSHRWAGFTSVGSPSSPVRASPTHLSNLSAFLRSIRCRVALAIGIPTSPVSARTPAMQTSPLHSDDVSTGAVAGRIPGAARIILCVASPTHRDNLERAAIELADVETLTTADRAISVLLRESVSLAIFDEQALQSLVSPEPGTRSIRELANVLANNAGNTQILIIGGHGSATSLPSAFRTEELSLRTTVLNPLGLNGEATRTVFSMAIRQAESSMPRQPTKIQTQASSLREVLGGSPRMLQLFEGVQAATQSDSPVLICGEHGTGTSLIANSIHDSGTRSPQSFVRIHSRSLTADSLNELLCVDVGEPEAATLPIDTAPRPIGGTLFLDELDAFPVALHKQLCRFAERQEELQEGSQGRHRSAVRIIAATHLNLDIPNRQTLGLEILSRGLKANRLIVPALRERPEDIAPLAEQFFIRWALQEDQPRPRMTRNALESLKEHRWAGNLRELYTVLRNTAIVAGSSDITADVLRPWLTKTAEQHEVTETPRMTLADMERQLIETTFARCGGNREKTATSLDIGLRTLSGKLREYGYPPRGGPGSNLKAA